jgi:hypothetical protein
VGGCEARDHRAISGLAAVLRKMKLELLRKDGYGQLIEKGREIQRELFYAHFPLKVAGKWVSLWNIIPERKPCWLLTMPSSWSME